MIELGKVNTLQMVREVTFGVFLGDGEQEVLLPRSYVPEGMAEGDSIDVFVYRDSQDRMTAVTDRPLVEMGGIAYLKVVDVSRVGAFVDWGMKKDLLVPFAEQEETLVVGKRYLIRLCLDERTDRLFGSNRIKDFVCDLTDGYSVGDEVDLIVAGKTDLGCKVIVDEGCWGLIFEEDLYQRLWYGQRLTGYVKNVRPDTRLDIALQLSGYARVAGVEQAILTAMAKKDGSLAITAKSPPEAIYDAFGISKKAFKLGVSALYRKRLIEVGDCLTLTDAGRAAVQPEPAGDAESAGDAEA